MNINIINKKIKKGNWIILYYSDMCGYCVEFMPVWNDFVNTKPKKINIIKIDYNTASQIEINPGFQTVPTIHFYKNGKLYKKGIFTFKRNLKNLIKFMKLNMNTKKTKKKIMRKRTNKIMRKRTKKN